MPVNQPQISENPVESSWQLEVTILINELEQRVAALQTELDAAEVRIAALENS